jgi:pyruvyl transferase EpsO
MFDYFDRNQRCVYIDYPLHTNVGDLLINAGVEQFLSEQKVYVWKRFNYYDFPKQIPGLKKSDVMLLHGGGNFGDLWFNFQAFRERILATFPDNRVIFLPQTVHFKSQERMAESIARINSHRNNHVFARDLRSLELLKRAGLHSVSALPDTAHALFEAIQPSKSPVKGSVLKFIRKDIEATPPPAELADMKGLEADWDDGTFGTARRMSHLAVVNFVKGAGRYGPQVDWHALWYWHRDGLINDAIDLFSQHETIFTNRLHAMILGLLLNRPVIAYDNNYGKLSTYRDSWFDGIPGLDFRAAAAGVGQKSA